ncbi:sigma-70 family RNA polymerase sigma factor [Dysgonomonas sp. GY75]|uniref:RNA polymerase sigma factor n=1 Tax=Dysgonomonas sp. GY75 TaxID=2780419 RepID=UPI0018842F97|nr:sigma-70 family RNA polymerase sigma factor [Dysgonomonas sp. GY75]MBF0648575.1 sigma-70 family RNA polymerase sigma factor [Dysgonomonas sp. GY75]
MEFNQLQKTELFNKYILPEKDFIYRVCLKYSKTRYECQEYYSETMFRVFNFIETYNPQLHIRPWLYTITRRIIGNLRIEQCKHNIINIIDIEQLSVIRAESNSSNCIDIDNYQQFYSDNIINALNTLNPVSRNAILLQQSGYSLSEIADKLYCLKLTGTLSINTVKYHLRTGKL